jgi:hypothetical protein
MSEYNNPILLRKGNKSKKKYENVWKEKESKKVS